MAQLTLVGSDLLNGLLAEELLRLDIALLFCDAAIGALAVLETSAFRGGGWIDSGALTSGPRLAGRAFFVLPGTYSCPIRTLC